MPWPAVLFDTGLGFSRRHPRTTGLSTIITSPTWKGYFALEHENLGRNRYKACIKAGVTPRFTPFEGNDPIDFVYDKNAHRRHLTDNAKVLALAACCTLKDGQQARRHTQQAVENTTENHDVQLLHIMDRERAAAKAGVSPRTMSEAVKIIKDNDPVEIEAVIQPFPSPRSALSRSQ